MIYGLTGHVCHCPFVAAVPGLELSAIVFHPADSVQRSGNQACAAGADEIVGHFDERLLLLRVGEGPGEAQRGNSEAAGTNTGAIREEPAGLDARQGGLRLPGPGFSGLAAANRAGDQLAQLCRRVCAACRNRTIVTHSQR